MNLIVENWAIIPVILIILALIVTTIHLILATPSETQLAKVREWLLWAVTEAEKELGGGTGKLKLRQVYDLFVTRFGWLARVVSFELFSELVDDALEEMREMLNTNQAVMAHVKGSDDL